MAIEVFGVSEIMVGFLRVEYYKQFYIMYQAASPVIPTEAVMLKSNLVSVYHL